jgi:hypothetical protein
VLLGLQLAIAVFMLAGSLFMPFSPRWLAMRGRNDEAEAVLKRMHSHAADPLYYRAEMHQIISQLEVERTERVGFLEMLRWKSYRKRLLLCAIFLMGQQAPGIIPLQK